MTGPARLFIAEQSAIGIGGHYFAYTSCIADAAQKSGLDVTILYNHSLKTSWNIENIKTVPAFYLSWSEAERQGIRDWAKGNIAHDFDKSISGQIFSEKDHILFPTLGKIDLENILNYLLMLPPTASHPNYHIILRYDVSEIVPLMDVFGPIFKKIARSPIRDHVHFHTDTDLLSEDYMRVTQINFSTLPIPFNQTALEAMMTRKTESVRDRRTIIYLGDARLEKNFHAIPDAATTLWDGGLSRSARFQLQCNFNCVGGEPGQMAAVQKLGQFPASFVQLMSDPLSDETYYGVLAEADIVLIPYDAERYRSRSSGVLVEAMAAGKPVVTTRGSWMETFVSTDQAVIIDRPEDLGTALMTLLEKFDDYKAAAEARAPEMLDWSSGANFIRHLMSFQANSADAPTTGRPHALVIMNGNATVLRNGASRVAEAQLDYLSRRGYAVTGLFLGRPDRSGLTFSRDLLEAIRDLPLDSSFLCCPPVGSLNIAKLEAAMDHGTQAISHDIEVSRSYQFDSEFLNLIRSSRPDVVLLNYITNYGIIEALNLRAVPLVCEMHDVQSFQKAIYGNRPIAQADLDQEFSYLAKCRALISLNPVETQFVQERLPDIPCATTGVQLPVAKIDFGTIAGCRTTADIIRLAAPAKFGRVPYGSREGGILGDVLRQIAEYPSIDLLFVSSNHKANAAGLREFLETVYIPVLAPLGISFVIAGSIDTMGPWPEHPLLAFVGRVDNLDVLYAAARLVVLPISEGAGSPVKTYEAVSYRRPVVASPLALRGFETGTTQIAATPIADFAEEIMRLLSDDAARSAARAAMHDYLVDARARMNFDQTMDQTFATVLDDAPIAEAETRSAQSLPTLSHVEWTVTAACVSGVVRGLLLDGTAPGHLLDMLAREDREEVLQIARQMLDALIVRQDAPLLEIESDLASAVRRQNGDRQAHAQAMLRYLDMLLTDVDHHDPAEDRQVIVNSRNGEPIRMTAMAFRPGASPALAVGDENAPAADMADNRVAWTLHAGKRAKTPDQFTEIRLNDEKQACFWIASQRVSNPEQKESGSFIAPDLGATANDLLVVEFEFWKPFKADQALGCRVDGQWAELSMDVRADRTVFQVTALPSKLRTIGSICLQLQATDQHGSIMQVMPHGVTVHRIIGGRGAAMLRYLEWHDAPEKKGPDDFSVRADVIARALEHGLAMERMDLSLVRANLALSQTVKGLDRRTTSHLRRLLSEIAPASTGDHLVLSPLLPLIFDGADSRIERDGRWQAALPAERRGWSIRLTADMLTAPPLGIALADYSTPPTASGIRNEHLHRWSIPIALPAGARISIELDAPAGKLNAADFAIIANAQPLDVTRIEQSSADTLMLLTAAVDRSDDLPALELLLYIFNERPFENIRSAVRAVVLHMETGTPE